MEWDFSPLQVLSGEVRYTLSTFKEDLRREVLETVASFPLTNEDKDFYCDLIYLIFNFLAANQPAIEIRRVLVNSIPDDFPVKESLADTAFIVDIGAQNNNVVEMLRALLTRHSILKLDSGMSVEEAARAVQADIGIYFSR